MIPSLLFQEDHDVSASNEPHMQHAAAAADLSPHCDADAVTPSSTSGKAQVSERFTGNHSRIGERLRDVPPGNTQPLAEFIGRERH